MLEFEMKRRHLFQYDNFAFDFAFNRCNRFFEVPLRCWAPVLGANRRHFGAWCSVVSIVLLIYHFEAREIIIEGRKIVS